MKPSSFFLTLAIVLVVVLGGGMTAWTLGAPPSHTLPVATVSVDTGEAWVQKNGAGDLQQISVETPVHSGDVVKTGEKSRAHVDFFHGSSARLDERSEVVIDEASVAPNNYASSNVTITVRAGRVWNRVLKFLDGSGSSYAANMSNVVATVRGTTFLMDATNANAWLVQTVESAVGVRIASDTSKEQMTDGGEEAWVPKVASTSPSFDRESVRLGKRKIAEKTLNSEWFGNNTQWDEAYVKSVGVHRTKELRDRAGMLPGSLLYGLKHLGEKLRIALTSDALAREDIRLQYADRRFAEIVTLTLGGRRNVAERLLADYESPYLAMLGELKAGREDTGMSVRICGKVHGRFMEQDMYVRDVGNPESLEFLNVRGSEQDDARALYRVVCENGTPSMQLPPTSMTPPVNASTTVHSATTTANAIPGETVLVPVAASTTIQTNLTLVKVTVMSRRTMLTHPDTEQIRAYAIMSDGSSKEVTNDAVWESSNAGVFTVQNGFVTTVAPGTATLRATYQNILGTFSLRVLPQVAGTVTAQSLMVSCSPSTLSLAATFAQTSTCSATVKMSDGSESNVTGTAQFSTNSRLGRVNGNVFTPTGQTGTAVITATYSSGTQLNGTAEILIR